MIMTQIMAVTPAMAETFLSNNSRNRPVSESRVALYAEDMKNGKWQLTHQGVAIDEDGVVGDGQHRLRAIIRSGCTIVTQVTTGLPRSSIVAVDRGYGRKVTDALAMSKDDVEWLTPRVAAATRWAYAFQGNGMTADTVLAHAEVLRESLVFATQAICAKRIGVSRASVVASVALIHASGEDPEVISDFTTKLLNGVVEGEKESGVIRLREWLMASPPSSSQPYMLETMARTQRAYQLFRDKIPCKILRAQDTMPYPRKKLLIK